MEPPTDAHDWIINMCGLFNILEVRAKKINEK